MIDSHDVEIFVSAWLAENLRVIPGLTNLPSEMDRLAADLTGAARLHGISGGDIHRALGDVDDYLTERYRRISAAQDAVPDGTPA